jgi:CheY-like chemotaxis protein
LAKASSRSGALKSGTSTILIVEDDANDVLLIKRAFAKAGNANPIQVVTDGDQAVAYLKGDGQYEDRKAHPLPALVLLDLKLPRRSGLEVLEWIRSQEMSVRRIPVTMLTSSRETADINRAYDLGVNSYLVKPVTFDSLIELVRTLDLYWVLTNEKPEV